MKTLSDNQPGLQFDASAPEWAYWFATIGSPVRDLLQRYLGVSSVTDRFGRHKEADLKELASALRGWSPIQAAQLLEHLLETCKHRDLDLPAIARWSLLQVDDPEGVCACMDLVAPPQIEVTRLLPRTGSQKLVFEARWRLQQKRVVLKKLTGTALEIAKVTAHELHSHPLSMRHPNIIETHFLSNGTETFLVEELLPKVLNDGWRPDGLQESANLLYSLSKAIEMVHGLDYVHGDIKPDNIGKKDNRFLLLDFGICRRRDEFSAETSATGSLRTRAPELLMCNGYVTSPLATDIWAIGATVFNFQEGRFPLVRPGDIVPRISSPLERAAFEKRLADRVRSDWDNCVRFEKTPSVLRPLIGACLDLDPQKRPTATQLKDRVEHALPAYIPESAVDQDTSFAPVTEMDQLLRLLRRADDVRLLAADDRGRLRNRVSMLKERLGRSQDASHNEQLERLEQLLSA